jgi:multidrug efflux system outer membrane protein
MKKKVEIVTAKRISAPDSEGGTANVASLVRNTTLPLLLLVGLLSGCAVFKPVGPDYAVPSSTAPDLWQAALTNGLLQGEAPLQTWWTLLNDPVLDELIVRAGQGNRDLKSAAARIREAMAIRGISRSEWFPTVNGVGSVQKSRTSESSTPVLPPGLDRTEDYYQLGASAGWEIDFWGRIRRSVESARAGWEASIEDYRDTLVLLYAQVALTYVDVRTLQARIDHVTENLARQRETLELTKIRYDAELVPELDVNQAELNAARTEAALPVLETALARSVNRLGVLAGAGPESLHASLRQKQPIPRPPGEVLVGIPVNVLRQRPDVRRAERLLAAQTARIGVATADLYPRLSLLGDFAFESIDTGDLLESGSRAYSFGPAFRWNLFTAGRVRNTIRVQEARTEQALQAYEQSLLLALEDVEGAMVSFAKMRERQESLRRAVEAAEQSVKLVQALYRSGLTDFQNVLSMEQALTQQQDDLAANEGDMAKNLVSLYRALGGGWAYDQAADARGQKISQPKQENP